MSHRRTCFAFAIFMAAASLLSAAAHAQENALNLQSKAMAKFKQLHERMQQLQIDKATSDPEESGILKAGNRFIQEKNLHDSLGECRQLIENGQYDAALASMDHLRQDMTTLLDLLLNRDLDLKKLMEEIATLEQFKERVENLIEDQRQEKEDAARAEALEKYLENLADAVAKVEALLSQQKQLSSDTDSPSLAKDSASSLALEKRETDLGKEAEDFQEDLEQLEAQAKELAKTEPGEGSEQAGSPGASTTNAASGAAGAAAKAMEQAAAKLRDNNPQASQQNMDEATAELERSKEALLAMEEEARRRLLELAIAEQAKAQESTRIDTDTLAKDMEKSCQSEEGKTKTPVPGQKNVQQAIPKQKSAAGSLRENKPGKAKQDQQDALDQLEEAQKKLDDALAQLRQELQDEVLRSLEERFGAMLAKQKELSARTKATHSLREGSLIADNQLPAAVASRCVEIADGELELATEAGDAISLLEEEGSTAVFPAATELIRDDLQEVAKHLQGSRTARATQMLQKDIEIALGEMIDSLRKQIESNESEAGQTSGEPPLVPMSAELKLLLNRQKRVNRRTADFDKAIPEQMRVTEEARDEALQISRKERWVKEMTRRLGDIIEKQNKGGG